MRTIRLTATLFLLALAVQARAADLALVISNQTYANAPEVGRVAANGTRLAELLEERGYRVVTGENLDRAAMQATLERFAQFLPDAERVIIYFAGHAVHLGSGSWLAPTDLAGDSVIGAEFNAPSVSLFLDMLAPYQGRSALFLAVPDEGFESGSSLQAGPGTPAVPQGVLLVQGAPEEVFAALVVDFLTPGIPVATALQQTNAELTALGLVSPDLQLAGQGQAGEPLASQAIAEQAMWSLTETGGQIADYEAYLRLYPQGKYAVAARNRLAVLAEAQLPPAELAEQALGLTQSDRRRIQEQLTVLGYSPRGVDGIFGVGTRAAIMAWQRNEKLDQTGFLTRDQVAMMDRLAKVRTDEIAAQLEEERQAQAAADTKAWRAAQSAGDAAAFRNYLARYPDGIFARDARAALDRIEAEDSVAADRAEAAAWETARNANTIRSYQRYLDQYPRGVFEDIARARQDDLRDDATRDKDRAELEAIEANLGLNKSSRTLVERRLELLGYRPGNVDGVFDATTRGAIRRFQQASRITVTGYLNANTVRQLIVASVR